MLDERGVISAASRKRIRSRAQLNARVHRTLGSGTRAGSFGEVKMRLPVHVALAWKQREGEQVMRDPFWQGYMRRHFPGFFPKSRSAKLESTVTAPGRASFTGLVDRTGCPMQMRNAECGMRSESVSASPHSALATPQ